MVVKKVYLSGQVKSIQYETNINSHIEHGNMLLKNWTKVLTLHTVLSNNTATYIIWIVWNNYWLSQKSVARHIVNVSFINKLFFRLNVSLPLCAGFRILCSVISCYDYIRLAILMSEACLFNCRILPYCGFKMYC